MNRRSLLVSGGALGLVGLAGCGTSPRPALTGDQPSLEDAFFYAFPLFELARTAQSRTGAVDGSVGTLNQIAHRAELLDHTSRQVTAPNNDTIYSSAFLELSGGPVEVDAPSSPDRYYCIAFMDAFTDNFAYVGTRATKGQGGRLWIAGPQWTGTPPDGAHVIRSSTNDVWMLMRTLVDGPADLAEAQAFQRGLSMRPAPGRPAPRPFSVRASEVANPTNLLGVANDILARSPGGLGQTARAGRFAHLGVGADVQANEALLARWREIIPGGLATLREKFLFRDLVRDGWSYQERGVGDFGVDDKLRAAVALGGLAALGEEEAMYFHANFNTAGERLSGQHRYRWRVPAGGVPADAFWSLTMYRMEPDGRFFLVDNPMRRYSIGDRTPGLHIDADGSFEILLQHEQPAGAGAANWLPAPDGPMRLALRAYMPRPELIDRKWRVPPLHRM